MNTILKNFQELYGYKPSVFELHSLYSSGSLTLSDSEENAILDYFEKNLNY